MEGLIRCSFCGGISKLYRDYARADVKADEKSIICDLWYVSCTKCGTKTKSFLAKFTWITMEQYGLKKMALKLRLRYGIKGVNKVKDYKGQKRYVCSWGLEGD